MRIEDLDRERCSPEIAERQLADLAAIGIDWDGPVEIQTEHGARCESALATLEREGLLYPCFCTRAQRAAQAPHGAPGRYSGRCRDLPEAEARRLVAEGGRASVRAMLGGARTEWHDLALGPMSGVADDPIVRRADGVFAYNLAVVADDCAVGVDQVVRGADLVDSVPVQAALCDALGFARPLWAHVPLVLGADGERLAKRAGGATLAERVARGQGPQRVLSLLGSSLGLCSAEDEVTGADLLGRFDPAGLPREEWILPQAP